MRSKLASARVSIIGLMDPLYTVYTHGQILRMINSSPYELRYVNGTNTSNFQSHINGYWYSNSTGPSYLMRLEQNFGNSSAGIESVVRLPDFQAKGLPIAEKSCIDYVYFNSANDPPIYSIKSTFVDWLRIDSSHLGKYNLSSIATFVR
jgi:hypothetical protein